MKIIAVVSSAETQWMLMDDGVIVQQVTTEGINPFFQTRKEISHLIRLQLPEIFFKRRCDHIYFYGAGCKNPNYRKIVEGSIVAQLRVPVTVETNLLGAARGLFGDEAGIACMLGSVSNTGLYDGRSIVQNVRPLGYLLGDEGSGAYFGKTFLSDYLKGFAPKSICEAFAEQYRESVDEIMDKIYTKPSPEKILIHYSNFLHEHINNEYVYHLIYTGFMKFFARNISVYDYGAYPISFVGDTACRYQEILRRVASDFGTSIREISPSVLPGLLKYHSTH